MGLAGTCLRCLGMGLTQLMREASEIRCNGPVLVSHQNGAYNPLFLCFHSLVFLSLRKLFGSGDISREWNVEDSFLTFGV